MKYLNIIICAFLMGLAMITSAELTAYADDTTINTPVRPIGRSGTIVVPEKFLREWDPVTVFFTRNRGEDAGTPEDNPGKILELTPDHPGAWMWLDRKTLQFRPAEPWRPYTRYSLIIGRKIFMLDTLMSPPLTTTPSADTTGLDPVEIIALTFPVPVDIAVLNRMITLELRPLPGLDPTAATWLDHRDFHLDFQDRSTAREPVTAILTLNTPIPPGTRAILHLKLARNDMKISFTQIAFSTAESFRILAAGSRNNTLPVTPEGTVYGQEQAIRISPDTPGLILEFSTEPDPISPVELRNFIHITPGVENLSARITGNQVEITGEFISDRLYRAALMPFPLKDTRGQLLDLSGKTEFSFYFLRKPPYLRWTRSQGVMERYGPHMIPLTGRGHSRMDLRIHPIDPMDRSFWPFPESPVMVDESQRPPGPGEESGHFDFSRSVQSGEIAKRIHALGTGPVSAMVSLPLADDGRAAGFGLDISNHLETLSGKHVPGTYLVGLRRLDSAGHRAWMRIQVTDLSLTTLEEHDAAVFAVTSLKTGAPVRNAGITVEGHYRNKPWITLYQGKTDNRGMTRWTSPDKAGYFVSRITVEKDGDVLVLNPETPPDIYRNNHWSENYRTWLQWTQEQSNHRRIKPQSLGHIFTERPVYRPGEPVYIRGWIRNRDKGALTRISQNGSIHVEGPGGTVWKTSVTMDESGGFSMVFNEKNIPTGEFSAVFLGFENRRITRCRFRVEAYRIPRFEIHLHVDKTAPMDTPFPVTLTARYYAGGRVADCPVAWRVSRFPGRSRTGEYKDFKFDTDRRISGNTRQDVRTIINTPDMTDENGSSVLTLDPAADPETSAGVYVIEATVTGSDDQTVTAVRRVILEPSVKPGLRVPRYVETTGKITPEIIVLGHDTQPVSGEPVTVRLIQRQWHSHLRVSDFTSGSARYITDVVDSPVMEKTIISDDKPLTVTLPVTKTGVYIIEVSVRDRLGRAMTVSEDLFVGGSDAVTWPKPATDVFTLAMVQESVNPGETAEIILKSPFQTAEALVAVEAPDGYVYHWKRVRHGSAVIKIPIREIDVPGLPVHVLLMRKRIKGTGIQPGTLRDLGRPATMAATIRVPVTAVENKLAITLDHPDRAQPSESIDIKISLADNHGDPVPGYVTLWLVDQSVLALGRESRLDPLPDFIPSHPSRLEITDTRNLVLGEIPYAPLPGGGVPGMEGDDLMNRITVRKNFTPVPFYAPMITVDETGTATVTVTLPDNLTRFQIRAKAVSGATRFGAARSVVHVRLPVIVQPALPRFVRPGDTFTLSAIGRIIEGGGGDGCARTEVTGLEMISPTDRKFTWDPDRPIRLDQDVRVPLKVPESSNPLETRSVDISVSVIRIADAAGDAFQITLPVRDDRRPIVRQEIIDLEPGSPAKIPEITSAVRPGSVKRSLLISGEPALLRMAAGLDFLINYPHGCTEQRISMTAPWLALKKFRSLLHMPMSDERIDRAVNDTLLWISGAVQPAGLMAYFPNSQGRVSLTAWVVRFLIDARESGYDIDDDLLDKLLTTLEQAMRSDYRHLVSGRAWAERCHALAALTLAGRAQPGYTAELVRKFRSLDLESRAMLLTAILSGDSPPDALVDRLADGVIDQIVFALSRGEEVYRGLKFELPRRDDIILASETRHLAEALRAVSHLDGYEIRTDALKNALITLGRGDGWGSTNANAAALMALSEMITSPLTGSAGGSVQIDTADQSILLSTGPENPSAYWEDSSTGSVILTRTEEEPGFTGLAARITTSYIPDEPGSRESSESAGFAVTGEMFIVQTGDSPPERISLDQPGSTVNLRIGDIVEMHIQVVNPERRNYVAVMIPLAAGMEPLNPALATAPPEARPSGTLTWPPTYTAFMDDSVTYYFNTMPGGSGDFYFRLRATVSGEFSQPAPRTEMMYDSSVFGRGNGARIIIESGKPHNVIPVETGKPHGVIPVETGI